MQGIDCNFAILLPFSCRWQSRYHCIITIICYRCYTRCYAPETSHVSMIYCCSYNIVTVYATCNVVYHVECFVLSTFSVCVQCSVWLFSVAPWLYVFHVFSSDIIRMIFRWLRLPLVYLGVCILHKLYFCCKFFIFYNLLSFFFDHISVSWNCTSVNVHFPYNYYGLLLRMVLSVFVRLFRNLVTLT